METANDKDLNQVINLDTLRPLVDFILTTGTKPNSEKAKIAQLFVETGFYYLQYNNRTFVTSSQEREIDDAINLSKQFTALLLPEPERRYYLSGEKY